MKKIIILLSLTFSLTAMASLPTPRNPSNFTCVKETSKTTVKLKYILEEQEHDFDVEERFNNIINSTGYNWLSFDQIVNCSNSNSEGVDFEILRKYTISAFSH
jgi:hypothetical protein